MEQSVPKRRHIKFRRLGIAQKKHTTFRTWGFLYQQEVFELGGEDGQSFYQCSVVCQCIR
jgi:hypothetical protein